MTEFRVNGIRKNNALEQFRKDLNLLYQDQVDERAGISHDQAH